MMILEDLTSLTRHDILATDTIATWGLLVGGPDYLQKFSSISFSVFGSIIVINIKASSYVPSPIQRTLQKRFKTVQTFFPFPA